MQTTFPRLLLNHAAQRPTETAMREKEYGIWQALSWADLAAMVEQLACRFAQAGPPPAPGQLLHHCRQVSPRQRLPDAVFFFTHSGFRRALSGVIQQKSRKSGLHPGVP